jgi:AcrR family transcriptional regulator
MTLDAIVDAALELVDDSGFDALSMRNLAARCGVGAMTLYGYVRTKDELLGAIADRVFAALDLPDDRNLPWEEQVKAVFRSVRRVFAEHPHLADVVAKQHTNAIAMYRGAEAVLGPMRRAGIGDEDAVSAFIALTTFTTGFAQREAHTDVRSAQAAQRLLAIGGLPEEEFANVVDVAGLLVAKESEKHFEDGLDFIVRGVAERRTS